MPLELVTGNVVIVAHHFNPSITDQIWLAEKGIVHRDEPESGYVFADMMVQVPTRSFHLLIVPETCQFTPNLAIERQQELIVDRLGMLVRTLPHTPFRAVGMNFVWHLQMDERALQEFSRRFFVQTSRLHQHFDVPDARFGAYLSKDTDAGRLRLDVKPTHMDQAEGARLYLMQFSFNYSLDLVGEANPVEAIERILNHWETAKEESSHIAREAEQ